MKRIFWIFLVYLIFLPTLVFGAVYELDDILDKQIKKYGIFNGADGMIYASIEQFEGKSKLFTVNFNGGELRTAVFDTEDGEQETDFISFPLGGKNSYQLSIGSAGADTAMILTTNNITEVFVMRNDKFTHSYKTPNIKTEIAEYKNGSLTIKNQTEVFSLLKILKNKRIRASKFYNIVNDVDGETKTQIHNFLDACADVMSYDKHNPDITKLMQYVLITHKNFEEMTEIPPESNFDGTGIGEAKISSVSEAYIDYIIKHIFGEEPQKPQITEMVNMGYCCNNGRYYYREIFNVEFSTEILDIITINNLGGGIYYVIFSDIYNKGDTKIEEYSFAVIRPGKSILRLGMGEPLLSDKEISSYAPTSMRNNYFHSEIPYKSTSPNKIIAAVIILSAAIIAIVLFIYHKR